MVIIKHTIVHNNKMETPKPKNAILGYTGLIGSYIRESTDPTETEYYNTKKFHDVVRKKINTVYCACVPAVKWKANKHPDEDKHSIRNIFNVVKTIQCEQIILISTIDVHILKYKPSELGLRNKKKLVNAFTLGNVSSEMIPSSEGRRLLQVIHCICRDGGSVYPFFDRVPEIVASLRALGCHGRSCKNRTDFNYSNIHG